MSTADANHTQRVLVSVLTFRRPETLRRCLASIAEQCTDGFEFDVCVVDNDPDRSAVEQVAECASTLPVNIEYVHEPVPGIPAARNTAVVEAVRRGVDWIAFIDDDERADPSWLGALLHAAHDFGADGVQGPVLPDFEEGGPASLPELGFHARPVAARGTALRQAKTGNLLLRTDRLVELCGTRPFREELADYGGSDAELTMRFTSAGGLIVTEPGAIVREFTPVTRQTLAWMERRAMRTTSCWVVIQRQHSPALEYWLRRVQALLRWSSRTLVYWFRYRRTGSELHRMQMCLSAARLRGHVMGIFGRQVAEYARSPGDG